MYFLQGFIIGIGMIVFIGPVFFLLLSISLQSGTRAGIYTALGIIVSDVICVSLSFFGVTKFLDDANTKFAILLSGGILLILLGMKYFFHSAKMEVDNSKNLKPLKLDCFTKGFLVNFVNPFVFFVWVGVVSYQRSLVDTLHNPLIFYSGVLAGILTTDLLKVFTARQIKSILSESVLQNLYRISGLVLIGFGVRMLLLI